jgi:isopenicillin N synthase-like dioxygenase
VSVAYYDRLGALCATVMEIFAVALGLPRQHFAPHIDKHFSFLRYVYYPALTEAAAPGQLRAGAHSDYGTFTLVNFDDAPGGLQVLARDSEWIDVPVVGDSFVCNIGDLFEVWTNDRWVSTLHRVAIPADERWEDSERLSLVYFHEPNWDTVAEALPTCVGAANPAKYEPLTAGEHNRRKVMRQQTLTDA